MNSKPLGLQKVNQARLLQRIRLEQKEDENLKKIIELDNLGEPNASVYQLVADGTK